MTANILDNIDLQNLGEALQQARKQCRMTQADAAQVIDAARTTLVAIEKGERRLKPKELISLARAYGKPVSDFVQPRPASEPFERLFRAAYPQGDHEATQIEPIVQQLEALCRNYLELEAIMEAPLSRNEPPEYDVANMPIKAAAESIAIADRQRLGLGDGPIPQLREVLEQTVGLRIFYLAMPPHYGGIYSYSEPIGGCIAINSALSPERRRHTLARQYLHFLTQRRRPVLDYEKHYQRIPEHERLAALFPNYFLMPTSGLLQRFSEMYRSQGKFTPTHLFTLAHYYGVGIDALISRLEDLELIPPKTEHRLRDRGLPMQYLQPKLSLEQQGLQWPDRLPIHYQHLAIEALDQGLITEGRFADFLGVDRLEARRIAEALREYSSGITEATADLDLRQV
jgi:Zn-dependent peptidase ImmA (M78 family)/DNA-binding XRE family transcriptional regulator